MGRVKAAGLSVPWLEVQAESTARDPFVLCTVVNERLTGDDESSLRWALRTTRAGLPEKLTWRLNEPVLLDGYHEGTAVPTRLVKLIFQARAEASSFLQPWHCPPCAEHEAAQNALRRAEAERQEAVRLAEAQERAATERERQRRQQERQQWVLQALTEQRELFGPGLQHPFRAHDA